MTVNSLREEISAIVQAELRNPSIDDFPEKMGDFVTNSFEVCSPRLNNKVLGDTLISSVK